MTPWALKSSLTELTAAHVSLCSVKCTSNDDPCRGQGWLWHVAFLVFRATCPQVGDTANSFGIRIVRMEAFLGQEGVRITPSVCHDLLFPIPKALPLPCNSRTRLKRTYHSVWRQGLSQLGATFLSLTLWSGSTTSALSCFVLSIELPLGFHCIPAFASSVPAGLLDQCGQCPCPGLPWAVERRMSSKVFLRGQGSDPWPEFPLTPTPTLEFSDSSVSDFGVVSVV